MPVIKDQENIEELRKRLYERGGSSIGTKRHNLTDEPVAVARGWGEDTSVSPKKTLAEIVDNEDTFKSEPPTVLTSDKLREEEAIVVTAVKKPKRYRKIILLTSVGVLVLATVVSSAYMLFGGNQISANNISINMEAPFSVAGGDNVPLQLSIANQNSVPIESATLILNYPPGTKSADQEGRDLYEERIPIAGIEAGETINVPVQVVLFGEENEDKEIKATVEYRVVNSNSTFFKEAIPVIVKINSSPLVMRVTGVNKISSGQEMEVTLTLQSNATTPMKNILISATYPNSFSLIKSDPTPSSGQNEWLIDEVMPDKTYTIKLRGLISGLASEASEIQFKAGNPKADNQFALGSTLTQAKISFTIEKPFIDVGININGDTDGTATLSAKTDTTVAVTVTNTLDETIYDMRVELAPKGNMIRDGLIDVRDGFYESSSKKINWEIASMSSLEKILPGENRKFEFKIKPDTNQATGAFDLSVKVFSRRVNEANASEELIGSTLATAKYSSEIKLNREAGHQDSPFSDSGPVPPVAGKSTYYTITLEAKAGVNDITGGILTTSLPQYVSWLNKTNRDGEVEYNPVSKQLRWKVGEVEAGKSKQLQMQVTLLPSVTHIGRTLTLLEAQDFRATDRFSNELLQVKEGAINTELSTELGFKRDNGIVQSE